MSLPMRRWLTYLGFVGFFGLNFLPGIAPATAENEERATAFELPHWFKASFLDLKDDVATAAKANKRLIVYIGQDGCPYCRELMQNNFTQKDIVDYTQRHFDVVAINMWGDADVTDFSGKTQTEKQLAAALNVKYTPTLLFFNEKGEIALRINGYFPPHQMRAALRYVAEKRETKQSFRDYYAQVAPPAASGQLHANPQFRKPPYDLAQRGGNKPLVVFFEQKECKACDEFHTNVVARKETAALLKRFDVVQLDMWGNTPLTTPQAKASTARDWAKQLNVVYAPSLVFFDANGREVMRTEAMLKAFHTQSAMDYVASGAYKTQPNFQRYIEERAGRLRAQGVKIDIWE